MLLRRCRRTRKYSYGPRNLHKAPTRPPSTHAANSESHFHAQQLRYSARAASEAIVVRSALVLHCWLYQARILQIGASSRRRSAVEVSKTTPVRGVE